jgi:N4-gp56 family major capsid protein
MKKLLSTLFVINYALNLQLFATSLNATTSTAEGNNLAPEMMTFYSDYLLDIVTPLLVHDQFAQKQPIPKNHGKTVTFRKVTPLPKALTQLVEGVTPDGKSLNYTDLSATVAQYGDWIQMTDMLLLTAVDNNIVIATDLLGDQAGRTLDTVTREVMNGGTSVMYADGVKTTRASLVRADKMTVDIVYRASRFLKTQLAKTIDGYYVAIIHHDVAYDLMRSEGWVEIMKYTANVENIYEGELGKVGKVRFVESTEAKIFAGAGTGGEDVYSTMFLGANAYGVTEIEGGGLEFIANQLGSAGAADPLKQRASVAWKATRAVTRLTETYMLRVETCSTFDSGAN